jgi:hypothetical protein
MTNADDSRRTPFAPQTDYDRRVLRALELAAQDNRWRFVWTEEDGSIPIATHRPASICVTACSPDGYALNIAPEVALPGEEVRV